MSLKPRVITAKTHSHSVLMRKADGRGKKRQGLNSGLAFPAGACRHVVHTGCRERRILICFDSAHIEAITQTFPVGLTTQREPQINLSSPQSLQETSPRTGG